MSRASRPREIDPEIGSIYGDWGIQATTLSSKLDRPAGVATASRARNQSLTGESRDRR